MGNEILLVGWKPYNAEWEPYNRTGMFGNQYGCLCVCAGPPSVKLMLTYDNPETIHGETSENVVKTNHFEGKPYDGVGDLAMQWNPHNEMGNS